MEDRHRHRADIQDVLYRYARGVDRRDWAAVQACFLPRATDSHGDFAGTIEVFVPWVAAMHGQVAFAAHFLGNMLVEFASNGEPAVETYFNAMPRLDAVSEAHRRMLVGDRIVTAEIDMDVIGLNLDHFKCVGSAWRIAERQVAFDCIRLRPAARYMHECAAKTALFAARL